MNKASKTFQVCWLLLTLSSCLLVIYLAGHQSEYPDVFNRYSWKFFKFLTVISCFTAIIVIANSRKLLGTIYAYRYRAGLFLASFLFMFVLMEVYLRVADPVGISYYEATARFNTDRIPDPDLGYRLTPSTRIKSRGGTETTYNEFGLRDGPVLPKTSSEYRILALGDSVTYGSGVAQDKIFTVRLQRLLTAKLGRPVRVINSGIGGYNTVQELAFLRKTGLSFEPDLVLLLYVKNDIEAALNLVDRKTKNKKPTDVLRSFLARSWVYRLVNHAHRVGWFWDRSISYDSIRATKGWQASMVALKNIVDTCERRGIPLIVFFWRMDVEPFTTALLEDVRNSVAPFSTEDTSQWFDEKRLRQYVNSIVDGHPNAEAHEIIAKNMAAYLFQQDFFHNGARVASSEKRNGAGPSD